MTKRLICDPPLGHRYGFPKEFPQELIGASETDIEEWFLDKGYPNHLVNDGMLKYCKYWEDNRKVTDEMIASIQADRKAGMKLADIAKKHGVGVKTAWKYQNDFYLQIEREREAENSRKRAGK